MDNIDKDKKFCTKFAGDICHFLSHLFHGITVTDNIAIV